MKRTAIALATACLLVTTPARASGLYLEPWQQILLFPIVIIAAIIDAIKGDGCNAECREADRANKQANPPSEGASASAPATFPAAGESS